MCVWAPCLVASKFSRKPASNFSNLVFVMEWVLICICASSAARATLSSNLLRIFCSLNNSFCLKTKKNNTHLDLLHFSSWGSHFSSLNFLYLWYHLKIKTKILFIMQTTSKFMMVTKNWSHISEVLQVHFYNEAIEAWSCYLREEVNRNMQIHWSVPSFC